MDLLAKAKTLGIQTEFMDGQGLHRVTDAVALKTILDALPPQPPRRLLVEPVVVRSGQPMRSELSPSATLPVQWKIVAGDKTVATGEAAERTIVWPGNLPLGIHRLHLADGASLTEEKGESRVVIMAPTGAEVYVDDERHGSIGRSGRVILKSIPPGKHVLRVAHSGDQDDERIIEIRPDADEQIIQAQFKSAPSSGLSPSQGGSLGSVSGLALNASAVVACSKCGSRFAAGTKFCGRCGGTNFDMVTAEASIHPRAPVAAPPSYPSLNQPSLGGSASSLRCTRCGTDQPVGTKFCGRCGASFGSSAIAWNAPRPVEVVCGTCSATYASGTKFCGRCGRTL